MELRPPPRPDDSHRRDPWLRPLLVAQCLGVLAVFVLGLVLWMRSPGGGAAADPARLREVANKLMAAGALDQAAEGFERYLAVADEPADVRARIAYSLGSTYLEQGAYEKALRWFYEAESLGPGELAEELGQKVVHSLERLGRHHAARAALGSRVELATDSVARSDQDPVVARIGEQEIRRSEVERMLDDLPPEAAAAVTTPEQKVELLRRYVAEELLWRKAVKLEYDKDPEVRRRQEALRKQLAVGRLVEREVFDKIVVAADDVRNFFEAHRERYRRPGSDGQPGAEPTFEQARQAVERDYRLGKMQSAYDSMVQSELSTEGVELFPERMTDG